MSAGALERGKNVLRIAYCVLGSVRDRFSPYQRESGCTGISSALFSAPLRLCAFALKLLWPGYLTQYAIRNTQSRNRPRLALVRVCGLFALFLFLGGCALTMEDQPRLESQEVSLSFADGAAARPRVPGTVARGELRLDLLLTTGQVNGQFVDSFPFTVTQTMLERGRERFDIFCAPCHGLSGDGQGVVTEYGMPQPESFHSPDIRDRQAGYYFSIITDGTRVMPSYAARIPVEDRWAIVAYIQALQLSQNVDAGEVPAEKLP